MPTQEIKLKSHEESDMFTPIYMKRGLNWNQLQKALAKLRRIDDQNTLRDIALNSPTIQVREAAIIPPSQERPA